jgi:hypothetical protein
MTLTGGLMGENKIQTMFKGEGTRSKANDYVDAMVSCHFTPSISLSNFWMVLAMVISVPEVMIEEEFESSKFGQTHDRPESA